MEIFRGAPAPFFPRLWIAAFIEGFSTLAVEVIAIRLAVPVVGSSATLTGVMLGVVLFALSAGYWRGGELSSRWDSNRTRRTLARNLVLAGAIYTAVSFPAEALLLDKLLSLNLSLGLAIGTTASLLFVLPVYLASQTVPMLAELTNSEGKAGKASGKILFFSTLGSVAGGILTPICLFPYLGVRNSTYVICAMLAGAAVLIAAGSVRRRLVAVSAAIAVGAIGFAHAVSARGNYLYSFDSAHQSIQVVEEKAGQGRVERVLVMGGGRASGIFKDTGESSFAYIREAGKALASGAGGDVLVLGAAGFTFPRDAAALPSVRQVDTVDVDPAVLEIAERHFLQKPLSPKVRFYPLSARDAIRKFHRQGKHYGFTVIDAYCGRGIPEELLTVEFFSSVRTITDRAAANVIMDRDVESPFARNLLASFRQAFGRVWIKDVRPEIDADPTNFIVTNWEWSGSSEWKGAGRAYTDNRNTADHDHVNLMWGSGD